MAYALCQGKAILPGKHHVQDTQIEVSCMESVFSLLAILAPGEFVSFEGKVVLNDKTQAGVILYQKYFLRRIIFNGVRLAE